jgi:MFS family permease
VIFGYATSLAVLFLSRLVQGAGGGTVGVIQAYVADATRPEDRAKSLGWLSAATNAGVALGPVLGSWSRKLGPRGAGAVRRGAVRGERRLRLALPRRVARARAQGDERRARRGVAAAALGAGRAARAHAPGEPASRLISIYAVAIGAFQGSTSILALFLALRYGVTAETIGYFFMYIGIISVLARAVILGKLVDRLGEARLSRLGIVLMALGLGALPLTRGYPTLAAAVALMPLGTAFTFPCVTAMLSRVISSRERGLYMGVQQTFGGASRAVFPIVAGLSFDHLGPGVPFFIAAGLVAATLLLGFDLESYVARPKAA